MKKHMTLFSFLLLTASLSSCNHKSEGLISDSNIYSITHGQNVDAADPIAKYTVALATPDLKNLCSGVIIAKNLILTAGHCFKYTPSPLPDITPHIQILFSMNLKDRYQYRKIKSIHIHQKYEDRSPYDLFEKYDLTVLEFDGGLPSGYEPVGIDVDDGLTLSQTVTVSGYGQDENREKDYKLKKVTVPIKKMAAYEFMTDETQGGSCVSDSGGPVFRWTGGDFVLVGITSRGDDNCKEFGIYTRVSHHLDWLKTFLN